MLTAESLRNLCNTSDGPYLRPFVANERWSKAQVFIVGTNPATPLRDEFRDFADYWDALTANVDLFEAAYASKHTSGASKSTQRSRRLLQQLEPLDVLVTNAMIYPAARPKYIPNKPQQRRIGQECFDLLIRICKPKVALFYGSEAVQLGSEYFSADLDPYIPIEQQGHVGRGGISLFAFPHFSGRGVRKGYRVGEMDRELELFAKRAKQTLSVV